MCNKGSEPDPLKTALCGGNCACGQATCATTETVGVNHKPQGPSRRETVVDRRVGMDRRQLPAEESDYTGPERRQVVDRRTNLERRRGPGRRLSDDRKSAEEGEMSAEQFEFIMAIETYKKVNKRIYPTWTEVLEVVRQLGYRKIKAREVDLQSVPEAPIQDAA